MGMDSEVDADVGADAAKDEVDEVALKVCVFCPALIPAPPDATLEVVDDSDIEGDKVR